MILNYDYTNKTILCISDMHLPYQHPDAIKFLEDLAEIYQPDLVVSLGDLLDFHNISFHKSDPDLDSAGRELDLARQYSAELEALFPEMYIVGSNHGDLPLRRFLDSGLTRKFLRSYNDIYEVGDGWKFVDDLTIVQKGEPDLYMCHNIKKNGIAVAQQRGQRFVQGHFHSNLEARYTGNPNSLLWACTAGCLIDKQSLAFAYDKLNLERPVLGTVIIEAGFPVLAPMVMNKDGSWIGEIK